MKGIKKEKTHQSLKYGPYSLRAVMCGVLRAIYPHSSSTAATKAVVLIPTSYLYVRFTARVEI